jgi:hypothetical protein
VQTLRHLGLTLLMKASLKYAGYIINMER